MNIRKNLLTSAIWACTALTLGGTAQGQFVVERRGPIDPPIVEPPVRSGVKQPISSGAASKTKTNVLDTYSNELLSAMNPYEIYSLLNDDVDTPLETMKLDGLTHYYQAPKTLHLIIQENRPTDLFFGHIGRIRVNTETNGIVSGAGSICIEESGCSSLNDFSELRFVPDVVYTIIPDFESNSALNISFGGTYYDPTLLIYDNEGGNENDSVYVPLNKENVTCNILFTAFGDPSVPVHTSPVGEADGLMTYNDGVQWTLEGMADVIRHDMRGGGDYFSNKVRVYPEYMFVTEKYFLEGRKVGVKKTIEQASTFFGGRPEPTVTNHGQYANSSKPSSSLKWEVQCFTTKELVDPWTNETYPAGAQVAIVRDGRNLCEGKAVAKTFHEAILKTSVNGEENRAFISHAYVAASKLESDKVKNLKAFHPVAGTATSSNLPAEQSIERTRKVSGKLTMEDIELSAEDEKKITTKLNPNGGLPAEASPGGWGKEQSIQFDTWGLLSINRSHRWSYEVGQGAGADGQAHTPGSIKSVKVTANCGGINVKDSATVLIRSKGSDFSGKAMLLNQTFLSSENENRKLKPGKLSKAGSYENSTPRKMHAAREPFTIATENVKRLP